MHIGFALYGGLDHQSGGFRYDRRLVEELRASGDTVDVINLPWRSYPRGLMDNLSPPTLERPNEGFDILIQDELAHPSLLRANRRVSCPVVCIVHHLRADEGRPLTPLYRSVERRYLDTVDAAICNSMPTRETVLSTSSLGSGAVLVAPPAGDRFNPDITDDEIADRARGDPFKMVFVGNVEPRKGLDTLVGGLAAVDSPWQLTVVGRATHESYYERVQEQVREAGCQERVRFVGRLADEELAAVLRTGHLMTMPSRHEGFGIAYLEGMGYGLPALATTAGGAREIVDHNETGVLVDPDDRQAITRAVSSLATDRDRLRSMGKAARRQYETHPDWETTADRVRAFLTEIIESEPMTVVR